MMPVHSDRPGIYFPRNHIESSNTNSVNFFINHSFYPVVTKNYVLRTNVRPRVRFKWQKLTARSSAAIIIAKSQNNQNANSRWKKRTRPVEPLNKLKPRT